MNRRRWLLGLVSILGGARALPALAQGLMGQVDMSSPRMTSAELDRAAVEGMIAEAGGGPVDLRDRSLNGLDLSGLDLGGARLQWARLNGTRLRGCDLRGADLGLVWALEADFTDADLAGADLFQGQFVRAIFDGADLESARMIGNFDGARFLGARLRTVRGGADMRNQSMGLIRASFRSAVLENADLAGADFSRADFEYAKLGGAALEGVDFTHALLGGADFRGCRIAGMILDGADIASADFRGVIGLDAVVGLDRAKNRRRAFFD